MEITSERIKYLLVAVLFATLVVLPFAYALAQEETGGASSEGASSEVSDAPEPEPEPASAEAEETEEAPETQEEETPDEEVPDVEEPDTDTPVPGGDAIIDTGTATSTSDVVNEANVNDVTINPDTGTSTHHGGGWGAWKDKNDVDAELNLLNDANASTTMDVGAQTGLNTATTTGGDAVILTGDAIATANVINVVNSNIINSYGMLLLLNLLFGNGVFDLRDFSFDDFVQAGEQSSCSFSWCDGGDVDLTINSTSTASLSNNLVVRASTGENTASTNGDGTAYISTGDAYAGANVVNVANTNIIDSNYLLIALNNFGDFSGDIVLPGFSFFEKFFKGFNLFKGSDIAANNEAQVDNNVTTGAQTGLNTAEGGNTASTTSDALIDTGNAVSGTNVVNTVNTNLFGGSSFYLLLNIHGSWSGDIFGLPEGISWAKTDTGVVLFSDPGSLGGPGKEVDGTLNNNALINNNIQVYALTGENEATGGDTLIETGDAYAGANIFNLVNTNIVGRNWIMGALNIFGNWSGNLSFGRPDLFVGGTAEAPAPTSISRGTPITYRFTVTNLGDSTATKVTLNNSIAGDLVSFAEGLVWDVGTLKPGESKEVSYTGVVAPTLPSGDVPLTLLTTATSKETDNNPLDNTEELTVMASNHPSSGGGGGGSRSSSRSGSGASLSIDKSANVSEVGVGGSVDYTIVVKNKGSSSHNSLLVDILRDEAGEIISEQNWDLGKIFPGEEITVTYTITFEEGTVPGTYTNEAQVLAKNTKKKSSNPGGSANSKKASVDVFVTGEYVAPLTEPLSCEQYLTEYIRTGRYNNPDEVTKLQLFLRNFENFPDVPLNGSYDGATEVAVRAFQDRYAGEVLTPWGIDGNTGFVYYTTQRKINEIYCKGETSFDLTPEQRAEIDAYRSLIERRQDGGIPIEDNSDVGVLLPQVPQLPAVRKEEGEDDDVIPAQMVATPPSVPSASSLIPENFGVRFLNMLNSLGGVGSWLLKNDPKGHQSSAKN
jgi:uncharacterized repeat protein (TIGR01451 family)